MSMLYITIWEYFERKIYAYIKAKDITNKAFLAQWNIIFLSSPSTGATAAVVSTSLQTKLSLHQAKFFIYCFFFISTHFTACCPSKFFKYIFSLNYSYMIVLGDVKKFFVITQLLNFSPMHKITWTNLLLILISNTSDIWFYYICCSLLLSSCSINFSSCTSLESSYWFGKKKCQAFGPNMNTRIF